MTEPLKLWLLSRTDEVWYDNFVNAVVAAFTEEEARHIWPTKNKDRNFNGVIFWHDGAWTVRHDDGSISVDKRCGDEWVHPDTLKVTLVGIANDHLSAGDVICAQYDAG